MSIRVRGARSGTSPRAAGLATRGFATTATGALAGLESIGRTFSDGYQAWRLAKICVARAPRRVEAA